MNGPYICRYVVHLLILQKWLASLLCAESLILKINVMAINSITAVHEPKCFIAYHRANCTLSGKLKKKK